MERQQTLPAPVEALDQYEKPSLEVAKTWLSTVILPRRKKNPATGEYHQVEMGEDPTGSEPYPLWGTSLNDLKVFGIGISLYFYMLVQLGIIILVLSLVSLPTMLYFLSDDYSGKLGERAVNNASIDPRIWGTAVCSRTRVEVNSKGEQIEIHDCPVTSMQMYIDLIVLLVLTLYVIVVGILHRRATDYIDEQQQTAADYSVVVKDPNPDAWDPDEWQIFFSQFGQVRFVTVSVDNHALLSALAHKRYMEEMLRMESTDRVVTETALKIAKFGPPPPRAALWKRMLQRLTFYRDIKYWQYELFQLRQQIHAMLRAERERGYKVWTVFVMFETEEAQRRCLRETTAGICSTICDSKYSDVPERVRFRGTNILRVDDPVEPSSVQWKFVGVGRGKRLAQQFVTVGIAVCLMIISYHVMKTLRGEYVDVHGIKTDERRRNLFLLAYALTALDIFGCKILYYTHFIEHHQTKEREQLSYLNKLLLFRLFNSAVVIYLLMDFKDVLAPYNLLQIQAILIANLTTTPVLQLISIYSRFMQWVFAPYSKTQKKLNLFYSGTYWQLSERYTEITKSVGIALFFKPILPTGLVVVSMSLLVNYWVDKYCLLRKWKVPPRYDGLLARASRYHLLLIILASLVMMGHWYNGWPYDTKAEVAMKDHKYQLRQAKKIFGLALSKVLNVIFPFPRKDYVYPDQKRMMKTVNLLIIGIITIAIIWLVLRLVSKAWMRLVTGKNPKAKRFKTKVSNIPSSAVSNLNAYVPSYDSWYSDFPYLCVDLTQFDPRYISWMGNHADYCLVNDVTEDSELRNEIAGVPLERLFGVCKEYDIHPSMGALASTGSSFHGRMDSV
ncbi:hypothetical protein Poli38472_004816 [Pythium oligandrum]|uniref:CSC1/OSCA1-like cytosolic domain-containing protein n=1 Tax=Pythium oligandrum TaxID=41045 RepID=A0A8K1FHH3_PYTOL|nr:hypothetical protein Poli38472_004816 [Pythium oligandrum]|eukprot:TMW59747.1 hypothetical protein Poli38472_004816 [Pythium oligandrum]